MHTVEDLENTLKDIFITTESTYNQQVELENLLEEVDPRSLIRTIWENSETIYSFRTEKNREQCMEYCESELFKKWVTLLYSENGSGTMSASLSALGRSRRRKRTGWARSLRAGSQKGKMPTLSAPILTKPIFTIM